MHPRILLTAIVLVPLVASHAPAQTFTVTPKLFPSAGKSVTVTDTATTRSSVTVTLGDKILNNEKKVEVETKQFTEKVLDAGDGKKPKKYTWTFSKATKGPEGKPADLSYAGKTLVFEREGGKYKVTAEGGGVAQRDLDALTKEANEPDAQAATLPKNPVKVGDTWAVAKESLASFGGIPEDAVDLAKFKAQGKLVKAYKKGNQQRGVIEVTVNVPLIKMGPIVLDKPIDLKLKAIFDGAIDGSSTARADTGTLTLTGRTSFTQMNMTFVLDIAISGDFRREVGAEK